MSNGWIKTSDRLPPTDVEVKTKIDDADGVRNVTRLRYGMNQTRLWWTANGKMYVYYTPTHWAYP